MLFFMQRKVWDLIRVFLKHKDFRSREKGMRKLTFLSTTLIILLNIGSDLDGNYTFKVSKRKTRIRFEIC